nr:MAG TPA: hypothetical protein [Caudoviricetes sp.]
MIRVSIACAYNSGLDNQDSSSLSNNSNALSTYGDHSPTA